MNILDEIKELLDEAGNLEVSVEGVKKDIFYIKINGQKYGYKPTGSTTAENLQSKFEGMMKHNAGRAIAWLKKNSTLVYGGKLKESFLPEGKMDKFLQTLLDLRSYEAGVGAIDAAKLSEKDLADLLVAAICYIDDHRFGAEETIWSNHVANAVKRKNNLRDLYKAASSKPAFISAMIQYGVQNWVDSVLAGKPEAADVEAGLDVYNKRVSKKKALAYPGIVSSLNKYLGKSEEEVVSEDIILSGSPGGGEVSKKSFPDWVPSDVYPKYKKAFESEYGKQMVKAGYEEDDDPLAYSEGELGEASGYVVISTSKEEPEDGGEMGIVYWTCPVITFKANGKTYYLHSGVAGL